MVFYHLQLVSWENVQQSHCDQNTFLTDVLINFSFFNDTYLMFPICQNPKYVKIINYLFSWLKILSKKICNSEVQGSVHRKVFQSMTNKMKRYTVFYFCKLLQMFRVESPHIIRSTHNCIYSIWYLSNRYCYLRLSWKSGNSSPRAAGSSNSLTSIRCCRHSVKLLMTGGGSTRNMWRSLQK